MRLRCAAAGCPSGPCPQVTPASRALRGHIPSRMYSMTTNDVPVQRVASTACPRTSNVIHLNQPLTASDPALACAAEAREHKVDRDRRARHTEPDMGNVSSTSRPWGGV
eukprot:scaffold3610_cov129-Isochrysis_galbana.AAC.1